LDKKFNIGLLYLQYLETIFEKHYTYPGILFMIKTPLRTHLETMSEAAMRSFLMNVSLTLNEEFANETALENSVKNKKDIDFKIAGIAHAIQFNCNNSFPVYRGSSLLFSKLNEMSATQLSLLILHISRIVNEDIEIFKEEQQDSISRWKAVYLETVFLNIDQASLTEHLSPLFNKDYFHKLAAEIEPKDKTSGISAITSGLAFLFPLADFGYLLS